MLGRAPTAVAWGRRIIDSKVEPDVVSTGAIRLATCFAKLWLTISHVAAVLLLAMLPGLSWCYGEGQNVLAQKCILQLAFGKLVVVHVTVHAFGRVGSTMIY